MTHPVSLALAGTDVILLLLLQSNAVHACTPSKDERSNQHPEDSEQIAGRALIQTKHTKLNAGKDDASSWTEAANRVTGQH